jgi:glutathione S-transferase
LEVFEEDTDGPNFTLFESGAIVQYLLDTQDHENVIWVSGFFIAVGLMSGFFIE